MYALIAQMVERILGKDEVTGSIPVKSSIFQLQKLIRGIAQSGSAPALGAGCREFESLYPDHFYGGSELQGQSSD